MGSGSLKRQMMKSKDKFTYWVTMIIYNDSLWKRNGEDIMTRSDPRRWRKVIACYAKDQADWIAWWHGMGNRYVKIKDKKPVYNDKENYVKWYTVSVDSDKPIRGE